MNTSATRQVSGGESAAIPEIVDTVRDSSFRNGSFPELDLRWQIACFFRVLLFVCCLAIPIFLSAAEQDRGYRDCGLPIYSIYSFDELGVAMPSGRLWQDSLGRICIFEGGNYRVFDGKNWEQLLDENTARHYLTSAKVSKNGQEYAGWIGSWGYFVDSKGRNRERFSITPANAPEWTRNSRFVGILELEDTVLFVGDLGTVRYHPSTNEQDYYPSALLNRLAFMLNGRAYVASDLAGLSYFDGTGFQPVTGSDRFSQALSIIDFSPVDENEVMLATMRGGLFRFDGSHFKKLKTEIDDLMADGITAIEVLPDGRIVVAVSNRGLFVLMPDGSIQLALEREYTTEFVSVGDLMRTSEGILWATTNSGVAKIYLENALTLIDHRMGVPLFWPYVARCNGKIYVRTQNEVYRGIYNKQGRLIRFEVMGFPGLNSPVSSIESHSSGMLLACTRGVFLWTPDRKLIPIIEGENITRVVSNPSNPDQIMVFGLNYNTMIAYRDGKFEEVSARHPSMGFPSTVLSDHEDKFWIELGIGRIGLIEIKGDKFSQEVFTNIPHLPGNWINIWKIGEDVFFSSDQRAIVRFDQDTQTFVPATEMEELMQRFGVDISRPYRDENGVIWLPHRNGMSMAIPQKDGKFRYDPLSLNAYRGNNAKFSVDGSQYLWFASENQLAIFDKSMGINEIRAPTPIIYSIISMDSGDAILNPLQSDPALERSILYRDNSLTFYVCPSNYALSRAPSYRFNLEGLSKDWSPISTDNSISFTNLPEGEYELRIQMYGQSEPLGQPVSFQFEVKPPVYRTWYAYMIYVGLAYLILLLVVRKFLKRAEKENARLERLVNERTKALDNTNDRLRLALRSAEHAAEVKSQFLANMSHEIRTPMNGVIGTVQLLKETPLSEDQNELLSMVDRSGNLLLHIINDILDYSKAEAGKIELESVEFVLEEMIESVLDILSNRIAESDALFVTSIDPRLPNHFIGDPIRLQQVLINFCSNALKFTRTGHITLRVGGSAYEKEKNCWSLEFEVQDTGIGIPSEKMGNLFTPFSQLDASNARVFGGTGLGLAISDRLVKLMGSSIQVKSQEGKGSSFGFRLKAHCPAKARPIVNHKDDLTSSVGIIDDFKRQVIEIQEHLEAMGFASVTNPTLEVFSEQLSVGERPDLLLVGDPLKDLEEILTRLKSQGFKIPIICYGMHPEWKSMDADILWMNQPLKLSRLRNRIANVLKIKTESDVEDALGDKTVVSDIDTSKPILIVEDSPTNRRVLELMLKRFQLKVDYSKDGKEALEAIDNTDYALVLMDVQLPGMDGIEVTQRIRSSMPENKQPVIVGVSANVMQQDINKALDAGMDEYIFKPIRISELHTLISKYL